MLEDDFTNTRKQRKCNASLGGACESKVHADATRRWPGEGGMGWGGVGGGHPSWVYFHIGCKTLDIC